MKKVIVKIAVLFTMFLLTYSFNASAQKPAGTSKQAVTTTKSENIIMGTSTSQNAKTKKKPVEKHRFFIHYINIVNGKQLYA